MKRRQAKTKIAMRAALAVVAAIGLLFAAVGGPWSPTVVLAAETYVASQASTLSGGTAVNLANVVGAPDSSSGGCNGPSGNTCFVRLDFTPAAAAYIKTYALTITNNGGSVDFYAHDDTIAGGTAATGHNTGWELVSGGISTNGCNGGCSLAHSGDLYDAVEFDAANLAQWRADALSIYSTPTPTPAPSATPSSLGLTTNLISYWAFDDGTAGSAAPSFGGETLSGIICSIVTNQTGRVGGMFFGGNSSCVDGADAAAVDINPTGDWTWAGWIYPDDTTNGSIILSKMNTTSDQEFSLSYNTGGTLKFCWASAGANCLDSSYGVAQNSYNFVAFGKQGGNAFIKVNNSDRDILSSTSGWQTLSAHLRFGKSTTTPSGLGSGWDEWGFWRSATGAGGALSDAQLSALWNAGNGCTYPFSSCASSATPTVSPTPGFCGEDGTPNCIKNGNMEDTFAGNWAGLVPGGASRIDANAVASFNTGPAWCGHYYTEITGNGFTQRVQLPAVPLFLSMQLRRKHDVGLGATIYPQVEIVKAGSVPGALGETYIAIDGKNGEILPGGSSHDFGWVNDRDAVHFLENQTAYYDVHIYNVRFYPSVTTYDNLGDPHFHPSFWTLATDDASAYQVDDVFLSPQGYLSYCPGGRGGPTVTPNTTAIATRTPTRTPTATSNATTSSTPPLTSTPAPATLFFNCDFEQGLSAWTGNNLTVQLAGGPVGPQFLRVNGADGFARQPFFWPGGTAYFTFWVGPGSGGSVHITNQPAAIDNTLWSQSESTPNWKLIKAVLPNLASGNYAFEVRGNDFVNMDFDGALPSENGYAFCGSGNSEVTPTSGPTSFVTPSPTPTPTSGPSPVIPTGTAPPVAASRTPNATWTATVTAAPATGTATASNTPTPGNGSTATSVAGTSTAAASVTQPTTTATSTGTPPTSTPSAMPNPTQQPEPAPNADCNRPDNPLNLAWWVDYEVCRVLTWFVWSPDNTNQMINIQATLQVYEPLGTLNELENARNIAQGEIQQYDWANTGLQGTTGLPDISILFPSTVPSGLLTGNLQLGPGAPNAYPFITACTLKTGAIFGDAMGKGLCATVNWLVDTGIMGWVQFLFDVAVWVAFMRYGWYVVVTKLPQIM